VKAVVDNILEYPHMGGKKGSATLAYHEKAAVGSGTYDEIKSQVYEKMNNEVEARKLLRRSKQSFEQPGVYGPGEAWGTDIATVTIRGESVFICKVLYLFTSERVGFSVSKNPDGEFVEEAFLRANMKEGRWPQSFILSDNGSPYKAIVFEKFFGADGPAWKFIPPGCPWYNGKVEVSWKDLKAMLWTFYSRVGTEGKTLVDKVSELIEPVVEKLNNDIPCRCLGDVTPRDVHDGRQEQQQERIARFRQRARKERKSQERVCDLEAGVKRHLRIEDMSDPAVRNLFALITKRYKLLRKGVSDNFARTA
jgi:transposase InsO family protein